VAIDNGEPIHSEKGFEPATTNNRMEMQAVIAALTWMQANNLSHAKLHTDSAYCEKGANAWRHGWRRSGWKRGEALIPNADLWQAMSAILDAFPISLHWVRGHSGNAGNEQADRLAGAALRSGARRNAA
jgi:ribonuclease HI